EYPLAEQPVPLRLERAVIDRLRLLHLTIRPMANLIRRRDSDSDLRKRTGIRHLAISPPITGVVTTGDSVTKHCRKRVTKRSQFRVSHGTKGGKRGAACPLALLRRLLLLEFHDS